MKHVEFLAAMMLASAWGTVAFGLWFAIFITLIWAVAFVLRSHFAEEADTMEEAT